MKAILALALLLLPGSAFAQVDLASGSVRINSRATQLVAPANEKRVLLIVQSENPSIECVVGKVAFDRDDDDMLSLSDGLVIFQAPAARGVLRCSNSGTAKRHGFVRWTEIVVP